MLHARKTVILLITLCTCKAIQHTGRRSGRRSFESTVREIPSFKVKCKHKFRTHIFTSGKFNSRNKIRQDLPSNLNKQFSVQDCHKLGGMENRMVRLWLVISN
jgi:hypothetical protein